MATSSAPAEKPSTGARLAAEFFGTFLLVSGVIGTAIFSAPTIGFLGVALALGFTVVIGAYAFGPLSGGHFNPAVTLGLAVAGRFAWKDVIGYIVAQILGGAVASSILAVIALGSTKTSDLQTLFKGASTGYDAISPSHFSLVSVLIVEIVTTALFVYVILGVTSSRAAAGFAPIAIGFTLTVLALIAIPVSNGSFNPARSIATAIYGGPDALGQLWVTIVAPIVGALIAGATFKLLFDRTIKA